MSRHDRPPSWAWALFSVACMKEAKGQGWVRSHDNKLTGPLAKGMGDRVAGIQRWQGDGVGDRKLPGEGGEWRHVTNSPPSCFYFLFFCLSLLPSSSISLSTFHVSPVISTCHTWTATLIWPWQFKTWAVSGEERWWGEGVWSCLCLPVNLLCHFYTRVVWSVSNTAELVRTVCFLVRYESCPVLWSSWRDGAQFTCNWTL